MTAKSPVQRWAAEKRPASRRGTSNGNSAGSAEDRRRRKWYLLETYRADVDVFDGLALSEPVEDRDGILTVPVGDGEIACRCYRCGLLLIFDTLTVDRIKPGCEGGTYRRENCRPSCMPCAQKTGGRMGGLNRARPARA